MPLGGYYKSLAEREVKQLT